jgi:hypothetical protein
MTLIAYDALAEESWSRLQHSGDDPNDPMRLLVLATVCTAGAPEARLMRSPFREGRAAPTAAAGHRGHL